MSDLEPARDESGQFAPAEPLTGQAGLEHDAGWKPLLKEQAGDAALDERQGAEELTARREDDAEPTPITLVDREALERGEIKPLDDPDGEIRTSLTPEWAAAELTTYREGLAQIDQEVADAELLAEVGAEQPLDQSAKPDPAQAETTPEQQSATAQEQAIQWLEDHPEAHAALSEHIQQSTAAADQARAAYVQQLDGALAIARQVTFALIPELNGVTDATHAASVLSAIQQQNPQRFAQIQQLDRKTGQLMAAAQNERHVASQRELQAVHAYNAEQERVYAQRYGTVDRATGESVRSYLQGLGATNEDLAALSQTRLPVWAQRALIDAAQMEQVRNAPKAVVKHDLPPVQRPGVARAPGEARQTDLAALSGRLNRSGSVDDAFALVAAMRANKR
ncbi:hypothetical protein M2222_001642 [Bradyrhizobium elkanii]|uniref:hypothetical protein n=1 Tax=Bradyrhizobium elkanii TaxID=29448 RepID=UPI00216A1BF3|nr:hypothetical protein [Bradyrhizobium elkanii]MCS3449537.1 hypothetical protein [Bradyrhizobium elkanii]MCS3559320.1 hypothetical protein [Bradyrhizobium elkanii]MCW2150834.1 hypothetical protein [Bradyrhizobium elkanii]MCW2374565.1 hypothetical protein [Bradyrhizobium elkanii]